MVVGEAPGRDEDQAGEPFVGKSGRFFNYALAQAGLFRSKIYITNVLPCRPPNNNIHSWEAGEAKANCTLGFWEDFKAARERGVKVVLTLGETATRMFGIEGKMNKIRGSVYETHGVLVIPTYHPSYLVRMGYDRPGGKVDLTAVWFADIAKAKQVSEQGWNPPKENFILFPSMADIEDFFKDLPRDHLIGCDIETRGGRNPSYTQIVCVGFAKSPEDALVVPFITEGNKSYWHNGHYLEVREKLNWVFQTFPLMFQNALYDVPILQREGFDISMERVQHDTMLMHHAIQSDLPHNLGFIVSIYGDTPYWKDTLKESKGDILDIPDEDRHRYNARDCVTMYQIIGKMEAELKENGTDWVYENISIPMLKPVSQMISTGLTLDTSRMKSLKREFTREAKKEREALQEIGGFGEELNLDSGDDLRWLLFGVKPGKFSSLEGLGDYEPHRQLHLKCNECKATRWVWEWEADRCPKCGSEDVKVVKERQKAKKSKDTKTYQDLQRLQKLSNIPSLYSPPKYHGKTTDTGKWSVDDEGRLRFRIALQKRLKELESLKRAHKSEIVEVQRTLDFLTHLSEYIKLQKILSTYLDYQPWADGRVHPNLLIHGTGTGRLACREPNLQNVPKKIKKIREVFIAPPGHKLISVDYTNLEVFIWAYLIEDEELIQFLVNGGNVHDKNTEDLFGISKGDPTWTLGRRAAKIFQFGGIQYGGGDREVHKEIVLEVPELNLTLSEYITAKRRWMAAHPAYVRWAEQVKERARNERISETPFGRKRILTGGLRDIEKQALNTPIQGGAGDIINLATVRIYERLRGMKSKLVLQIHDELIVEAPDGEVERATEIMVEEMQRPVVINGKERPLFVTPAIGQNLGQLEEIL